MCLLVNIMDFVAINYSAFLYSGEDEPSCNIDLIVWFFCLRKSQGLPINCRMRCQVFEVWGFSNSDPLSLTLSSGPPVPPLPSLLMLTLGYESCQGCDSPGLCALTHSVPSSSDGFPSSPSPLLFPKDVTCSRYHLKAISSKFLLIFWESLVVFPFWPCSFYLWYLVVQRILRSSSFLNSSSIICQLDDADTLLDLSGLSVKWC